MDSGALTMKLFTIFDRQSSTMLLLRWRGPATAHSCVDWLGRVRVAFMLLFPQLLWLIMHYLTYTATAYDTALKFDNHVLPIHFISSFF